MVSAVTGRTVQVGGHAVPSFIYGTAWKEDRTGELVSDALSAGFRGIDTANQRRHYKEEDVGRALQTALGEGGLTRADVFVQTKFTFRSSQDHRMPYDPASPIAEQVSQSFDSSLAHLGVDYLDSYLLHGPSGRWGLAAPDLEAWGAMETLHDGGKVRFVGVSNFSADQLRQLLSRARVRPAFVQNRCYAALGWDADVRAICRSDGVVLQAFSLLTANVEALRLPVFRDVAHRHKRTLPQVVFRFAQQAGMIPLTGTTNARRMAGDLGIYDFELTPEEVRTIEKIAG